MSSHDDDDDAMFDDALNMLDEQDREQQEKQARLEAMAEAALREQDGNQHPLSSAPDGEEAQLLGTVNQLLEFLKRGPDAMEQCPESEMHRIQSLLSSTLQQMSQNATEDELQSIEKCRTMLQQAQQAETQETNPAGGTDDNARQSKEAEEAMAHLLESLQQLSAAPGSSATASSASGTSEAGLADLLKHVTATGSGAQGGSNTAGATESNGVNDDDVKSLKLLFDLLQPEIIVESFRAMIDAFPAYFEQHGAALSQEERQRFEGQVHHMKAVLDVAREGRLDAALQPDATDAAKDRLLRFSSALEALQSFGVPPPELQAIIESQRAASAASTAA